MFEMPTSSKLDLVSPSEERPLQRTLFFPYGSISSIAMLEHRSGQCQEGRGVIPTLLMETAEPAYSSGVTAKGGAGEGVCVLGTMWLP